MSTTTPASGDPRIQQILTTLDQLAAGNWDARAPSCACDDDLGQIAPNALADLIAIKYTGPVENAASTLLQPKVEIMATIINGRLI